jgi:flavin reductase (DIM6/NTAB) family NADH-FMN oxidoreductase RutF
LVAGAVYNLECTLHAQVRTGDHYLFVGEIVAAHIDESAGPRLMNFGQGAWACAQMAPGTRFEV